MANHSSPTADEPIDAHDQHDGHVMPLATYFTVFGALLVLLVVTIVVAYVNLGSGAMNLFVALLIATVKAALIIYYFMHVKFGTKLIWVYAVGSFAWLLLLIFILFGDYWTRGWQPVA